MKKALSILLALVLVAAMGVTAFADDTYGGYAGGVYEDDDDTIYMDWVWNVFEEDDDAYCRVQFPFGGDYFDVYVDPVGVLTEYTDGDDIDWDWDDDSFEVYSSGSINVTTTEVALDDGYDSLDYVAARVYWKSAWYYAYVDDDGNIYIYSKYTHSYYAWYQVNVDGAAATVADFEYDDDDERYELAADSVTEYTGDEDDLEDEFDNDFSSGSGSAEGDYYAGDADGSFDSYDKLFITCAYEGSSDLYRIRIAPIDDYGVKVERAKVWFKMIDYNSGTTHKFTSSELYVDLYHVDVYDDDVEDVAGESKALVLEYGEPYDNEFDEGDHDCNGNGVDDYDAIYYLDDMVPDVISTEHFDEAVGKSLKITDLDESWQLAIAKIAEYQPGMNFTFNTTVASTVKSAFPDAKFQAVNFLSGATTIYKSAAKLYIDCDKSALGQSSTVYVYKYTGGALEYQDAFEVDYYSGTQAVYVELAAGESLGSYYLSNTDLRSSGSTETSDAEENPNTGAGDIVGTAVALAVVSLIAAAAITLKK